MCLADRTCGRAPHTWFAQASDINPLAHSLFLKWALRRHATSSQCLHRSCLVHSILFKVPLPYFFRLCQESLCPVAFIPLDTKLLHRGQFPTHPLATAHSLQYNPIPSSCPRVTHHPWMSTPEASKPSPSSPVYLTHSLPLFPPDEQGLTMTRSSWSAGKPPSGQSSSRATRLEKYKNDTGDNLDSRIRSGEQRPQSVEEKLGPHFANLP